MVVVIGIASTLYRVSVARRIAQNNGLDPRDATAVALLNDNGLSAAYVRGGMQQGQRPPADPPRYPAAAARRPRGAARHAGKITDAEYAAARQRIIDSL